MLAMQRTILLAAFGAAVAATPPIGVTSNGGRTQIFGNSFGVPGVNATYDYIVRDTV